MSEWIFPTLSEILAIDAAPQGSSPFSATQDAHESHSTAQKQVRAQREWFGAIAALEALLNQLKPSGLGGIVLSGPLPVLSQPELLSEFTNWSFTADPIATLAGLPFQLPPAENGVSDCGVNDALSLLPGDPLASEPFCLALTNQFSLVMVLGEDSVGGPEFQFSFDPNVVDRVWQTLRLRMVLMNPSHLPKFDALRQKFAPIAPHYKLVAQFSQGLLQHLPEPEKQHIPTPQKRFESQTVDSESLKGVDVEILQAIAHEVRTPLTTIRTLTRLLLRRKDLQPDVIKRLEMIDRECSEQIDRFGLIFRAVEIETSATKVSSCSLATTSLAQVLQQSIPRWQQQASQRNLTLDVILPQQLPSVVSDPTMLDQALTSLIDRSARSLPAGSRIQVEVSIAGHQLKLQLQSQVHSHDYVGCSAMGMPEHGHRMPLLKSLGQVLMFQPETGSLTLNLNVTKNLFQALGGKLIVRNRPEQGEVFTLFLPLEPNKQASEITV
jgi:hypothetical protein